ncbi:hypothetical protein SAMN06272738_5683 [Bacillus sp. JKS001846]|nr:hypothetical protein SAMN06272738_5683 [Bacillus sp. JKS001846]
MGFGGSCGEGCGFVGGFALLGLATTFREFCTLSKIS